SEASHLVIIAKRNDQNIVALIDSSTCDIAGGDNIAGDPKNDIEFKNVVPIAVSDMPAGFGPQDVMLMGAAARSRQMAGALAATLDLCVDYAKERVAFERPIAKFQTIQHNLARLAGEVAAAEAASGSAADAINQATRFDDAVFLETASAKIRVGEAAGAGAAIAHQVFGAIGFTQEHILHRLTRRLWAWRDDFGSESQWAVQLGARVAENGANELWPALAAR
ncbi:MAG: acyl-CoA dehydrogenase family protein, partial [Alphaproteobacteria bacterium]